MSLVGISAKCRITTETLDSLLNGRVTVGVTAKLSVISSSLQDFVNGKQSIGLSSKLGITSTALQELRNIIGKAGAIGMIIGLLTDREGFS